MFVMMALAIAAGYTVTVVISMVLTFAVTMAMPKFVIADYTIRNGYKLVHEGCWLICAMIGGYVAALVMQDTYPALTEVLLIAALIAVLWSNSWEARQRGTAHHILITALTVVGVAGGYLLQRRMA